MVQKWWLPYEWYDSPDKLDFPYLPDYLSRLKSCYVLKVSDWCACKRLIRKRGMRTFADWLRYYNDLHVARGKRLAF